MKGEHEIQCNTTISSASSTTESVVDADHFIEGMAWGEGRDMLRRYEMIIEKLHQVVMIELAQVLYTTEPDRSFNPVNVGLLTPGLVVEIE